MRRWLIVAFHEPYYTTQSSPALAAYFQNHLEALFYASAVDVVVNGHIHAYERSYPVYKNAVRRCLCLRAVYRCMLIDQRCSKSRRSCRRQTLNRSLNTCDVGACL